MRKYNMLQALVTRWTFWALSVLIMTLFVILGFVFFQRSRVIMEDQLKMNLRNTAAAAAMQFDGAMLEGIDGPDDMESASFRDAVGRLHTLRAKIPGVRFTYILRRTTSPHMLEFIADADSLSSVAELDHNQNGTVDDDEEPSFPGDRYDVSEIPVLQLDAFQYPATDDEVAYDQWGATISGYAPVRRFADGKIVGTLGIDMLATDYLASAYSIFSPGALFLVLLSIVCVTSGFVLMALRRQMEMLMQMDKERSGLLQLTFHQLGEPLTIFKWSLESLKERHPSESLEKMMPEHIKNMEIGIGRMSYIVDALRDAEQVELGSIKYEPVRASLAETLAEVARESQSVLAERKQTLEVSCENKLWAQFDPHWVKRILHELMKNATSYSAEGSVIRISAKYNRNKVIVEVRDNGVGISAAERATLFQKFARGENVSHHTGGTGLGLYTCRGILKVAKGKIWIDSEEGSGTTVSFTLPA
jgi:signal transduction histidine kinase